MIKVMIWRNAYIHQKCVYAKNCFIADNTVPVLLFSGTVNGTSGETVTFNLQGHDPDPEENLTYHIVDDNDGAVQVDTQTGDVTVSVDPSRLRGAR